MHRGAAEEKHEFYFFRNSVKIPEGSQIWCHSQNIDFYPSRIKRLSAVSHRCSIYCWFDVCFSVSLFLRLSVSWKKETEETKRRR
jgi:hypothetical protein